jgi:hypothetical protein
MKIRHSRYHWLIAAAVAALALLTLSEAWGQSTGAQAQFEGRPSMAGAQAGTGAAAGPPGARARAAARRPAATAAGSRQPGQAAAQRARAGAQGCENHPRQRPPRRGSAALRTANAALKIVAFACACFS